MIKLIASDLDGTLLQNGAQELSPRAIELIKELKEHNILFVAASGRPISNLRRLFEPVKDDIAYVAENGSLCVYKGEVLSKTTIDRELGLRIIDAVHNFKQCDCTVSGEYILYTDSNNHQFLSHLTDVLDFDTKVVDDLKADIPEPFLKMAVLDFAGTKECENYLKDLFSSEIKVVTSGNLWVDFIAPGTNKGLALQTLMHHLAILPGESIAFGDQYNDVEMLQLAGTSYAMSNAAPGISYYSTYVTDSVEEVLEDIVASLSL